MVVPFAEPSCLRFCELFFGDSFCRFSCFTPLKDLFVLGPILPKGPLNLFRTAGISRFSVSGAQTLPLVSISILQCTALINLGQHANLS